MTEKPKKPGTDLIRDIGEHYVCHVLPQWGIHAVLTRQNAEKVDVIAYCKDTLHSATIQVKTRSGGGAREFVSDRTEDYDADNDPIFCQKPIADFWVLIRLNGQWAPDCAYIWHSQDKHLLEQGQGTERKRKGIPKWTVNPYTTANNRGEWEDRKDDNGWRRLVEFLKSPAPGK